MFMENQPVDDTPSPPAQPPLRSVWLRWLGPIILLLVGAGLAAWLVPYMPDVMVDYGREVYVPWRITEGEAIYRDIEYFNGPISPYLHAMVFTIFGVSITTLKVFNVVLIGLFTTMLYRLLLAMSDRFAATVACLVFLTVFAFGHLTAFANFNWVTPYSYELPHGIGLSLCMIACLWHYARGAGVKWLVPGGVMLGLVFLTEAEVFLAAALAGPSGALLGVLASPAERAHLRRRLAVFAGGAIAPVAVSALVLWTIMPWPTVLSGLAGSWKWVGNQQLASLQYFKFTMGTLDTRQSLIDIATWAISYAALVGLMVVASLMAGRLLPRAWQRHALGAMCAAAVAVTLFALNLDAQFWIEHMRPAPLFMTGAGLVLLWQVWTMRREPQQLARLALPLMMVIFAGALLGKILLNVRPVHYGFALAAPAAVLTIVWLLGVLPQWLQSRWGTGTPARLMAVSAMGVVVFVLLTAEARMVSMKTGHVGIGWDRFRADPVRARFMAAALEDIRHLPTPNQTLVVMPEGLMLGYLARRINPSGHLNFTPPAMIMFGEEPMLEDLHHSAPDLIALIHTDTTIYDAPFFGSDYARQIALWIRHNYHPVSQIGPPPFLPGTQFGILLLRHNDLAQ
jgi:hypothetical protein